MVRVRIRTLEGDERIVEAVIGATLMNAVAAAVTDLGRVFGECGGNLSCGTCHCYISVEWREKIEPPSAFENAMLDCTFNVTDDSRLSCQIKIGPELDRIFVTLPPIL